MAKTTSRYTFEFRELSKLQRDRYIFTEQNNIHTSEYIVRLILLDSLNLQRRVLRGNQTDGMSSIACSFPFHFHFQLKIKESLPRLSHRKNTLTLA